MYNANYPKEIELPSSKQLLISTLATFIVASLLLITTVLPAEYGIDPTGTGKALGLTQMGEIKMQLAEEANQEKVATAPISPPPAAIEKTATTIQEDKIPESEAITSAQEAEKPNPTKSTSITLSPGEAAEVKVAMSKDQIVSYKWTIDKGHLNFDNHGDTDQIKYHNYSKGKAVESDEGEIKAAFDGKHGWFWRNRSKETVTLNLEISGEFADLRRVL